MNQGTACITDTPYDRILGLDIVPTRSQKLDALGEFFRDAATGAASFNLTEGLTGGLDTSTRRLLQDAHYQLDQGAPISGETMDALTSLVGPVKLLPLPGRNAILQLHADTTSVFAQMALEMAVDRGTGSSVRHCEVCGGPLSGHGNAKTCGRACKKQRKRQTDQRRYRRLKTC